MAVEDPRELVRRYALSLPETTQRFMKGDEHFIGYGATFAYLLDRRLVVKLSPPRSRRLLAEGTVALYKGAHSSRYGDWVEVNLATAGNELLRELVDLAYERVASVRGVAQEGA